MKSNSTMFIPVAENRGRKPRYGDAPKRPYKDTKRDQEADEVIYHLKKHKGPIAFQHYIPTTYPLDPNNFEIGLIAISRSDMMTEVIRKGNAFEFYFFESPNQYNLGVVQIVCKKPDYTNLFGEEHTTRTTHKAFTPVETEADDAEHGTASDLAPRTLDFSPDYEEPTDTYDEDAPLVISTANTERTSWVNEEGHTLSKDAQGWIRYTVDDKNSFVFRTEVSVNSLKRIDPEAYAAYIDAEDAFMQEHEIENPTMTPDY